MTPKLTDEQIIMALKYCTKDNGICNRNCPLWKNLTACVCARDCNISLMRMALVLINLLKEENREITRKFNSQQKVYSDLHHIIQSHAEELKTVKAEAYKEFVNKIHSIITEIYNKYVFNGFNDLNSEEIDAVINYSDDVTQEIDNFLKEMVGEG